MAIDRSKVKNIILKQLIGSDAINAEVANRVYPAHLATIEAPVFPCICFDFFGTGNKNMPALPNAINVTMNMWFYGQERKGYVQPNKLLKLTIEAIHRQDIQDSTHGINVVCENISDPIEFVDPELNVPFVYNRWEVTALA